MKKMCISIESQIAPRSGCGQQEKKTMDLTVAVKWKKLPKTLKKLLVGG